MNAPLPDAAGDECGLRELEAIVLEASQLLPEQPPLHAFVHHNTLHHFEHLPFEEAVVEASSILGTEGFQSEAAFAAHLASGRIRDGDLVAVVEAEAEAEAEAEGRDTPLFAGGPTATGYRLLRLRHPFEIPTGITLDWHLREGRCASNLARDLSVDRRERILERGTEQEILARLWSVLEAHAGRSEPPVSRPRWRDRVLEIAEVDTDRWVHPLLIRLVAAFLDQGIAYWAMPGRSRGFLSAVRSLYGMPLGPPFRWARPLAKTFARQERSGWSALQTLDWALGEGQVAESERPLFIRETLLSLRGWAGMMRQLELHPHRAPVEAPPARLLDYLAVQVCLDLFAAKAALRDTSGREAPSLAALDDLAGAASRRGVSVDRSLVFEAFTIAQHSPIPLERFDEREVASAWMSAVATFDSTERRRLLHLAYERRHRVELLDVLAARPPLGLGREPERDQDAPGSVPFQAVFCIDDREESIRRHLEEIEPRAETFGYAGFFGVAMSYQGLEDVRTRPLCPVVVSPRHVVREVPSEAETPSDYSLVRRRRAMARHATAVGTRTLVRGGLASSLLGPISLLPLVGHALFPRLAARIARRLEHAGLDRPLTRLAFESHEEIDVEAAVSEGYTVAEMADIVASAIRTMGLDVTRSRLVFVVGHGSSSLNNPHEAAHDCGATGGGRGGPNARAFAAMANHREVRRRLADDGLGIPSETFFVGAYHNTCDDSMSYYDEDLLPEALRTDLAQAKRTLSTACLREAHERCRKFETVPLDIGLERGLEDVQEHSVDLAQPRPEYGHATNAICIVGRRALTRGLFLDRRAFLVSYDPGRDPEGELLAPLLLSVGPVGAGINLEYYFSFVDPTGYGCGTKLPHNITGLLGVMDGHASDLRTGLPWQMVEIHEPVRLLTIVDARQAVLEQILDEHAGLRGLVANRWIQLVGWDAEEGSLSVFEGGRFRPYRPESAPREAGGPGQASHFSGSIEYYAGQRGGLAPTWLGGSEATR